MSEKLVNTIIKVGSRTPAGKLIKGGSKLIKLFRGENKAHERGLNTKTKGRWFHTSKDYVKYFTGSTKGERTLKTVNVTEKDYNIGRKIHDKVKGRKGCEGDLCSMGVILPKKNLKDVKSRKFDDGGIVISKGSDYIKDLL
jgi:hypothetical protein